MVYWLHMKQGRFLFSQVFYHNFHNLSTKTFKRKEHDTSFNNVVISLLEYALEELKSKEELIKELEKED